MTSVINTLFKNHANTTWMKKAYFRTNKIFLHSESVLVIIKHITFTLMCPDILSLMSFF